MDNCVETASVSVSEVVCDNVIYNRSSRHLYIYQQDWGVWRPCSCYCTMEQLVMLPLRIYTLHCMLPSRRVMKTSWRYFLIVELNTTPSHGYSMLDLLCCHIYGMSDTDYQLLFVAVLSMRSILDCIVLNNVQFPAMCLTPYTASNFHNSCLALLSVRRRFT